MTDPTSGVPSYRFPFFKTFYPAWLWLLWIFLVFPDHTAFAQTFSADGTFVPLYKGSLYTPLTAVPPIVAPAAVLDVKSLAAIKKKMLARVDAAIFNLQDDSLKLSASYDEIWGTDFTKNYLQDLKNLREKLLGTGNTAYTYPFLPDYGSLDGLATAALFTVEEDKKAANKTMQVINLIRTDPLAAYLLQHYQATYSGDPLTARNLDIDYVKDWRQLEAWYAVCKQTEAKASKIRSDIFSYKQTDIDDMAKDILTVKPGTLQLVKDIQASKFMRSWLWYTGGLPNINPLLVTDPEKRYPYTEKNTFFTAQKQHVQDSLNKSTTLNDFKSTSKYYNRLFLPEADPDDKNKYWLQEYDAAKNYTPVIRPAELTLDHNQQLRLAVYNIPANKKVGFSGTPGAMVYESSAVIALNKTADQLGAITALGSSNLAAFTKVAGLLNPPALNHVGVNFNYAAANTTVPANPQMLMALKKFEGFDQLEAFTNKGKTKKDTTTAVQDERKALPQRAIVIGGQWVPLTKKHFDLDKKRILWVSAQTTTGADKPDTDDPLFAQTVDHFIVVDTYAFLDYDHIEQAAKDLVYRFNHYSNDIKDHFKKLEELLKNAGTAFATVSPYVRISNRSLPPDPPDAVTDTVPLLRTALNTQKVPDAPAKLTWSVTEQGTDGKDAAKEVASETLKVILTQKFDFSIGLAWTSNDYYIAQDGQPLPTAVLGDRFQFTAGLHYYPFGRENRLHDKFGRPFGERFSVYAGLSIAHALDNYYTGLSYDWVPGIKTIAGWHFYKNYHYNIINNSVADKASGIASGGFFLSLNLEPVTIGKAIGLFK